MKGEWPTVRIEDVAEKIAMGPFGSNIKVDTFVAAGVPVISGAHLRNVRLEDRGFNFVTAEHAERMKNSNVFRGDVIFTHAGNIGQVAYIPPNSQYERYVISQRQFYLRCDLSKADPAFVSYFFHSPEGQHKLLANASQTGVPSIARPSSYLKTIELSLPPLSEQRAIAHILGTLDDKIELNRRRNQTLEAMARALFKDWFVDFGPVRARMQLPSPSGRGAGGEGNNPRPRRKLPLPDAIRRHAAELRRNATDAENLLWRLLRNQQLAGAKFRRQHALPPYILDFYCHELKLAVELDGGQHNEPAGRAHDERRTEYLHARGIEVLRFWNHDVLRDTEAVLEAIYQAIEAKRRMTPSPPAPLPAGEGSAAHAPLPDALKPFFSGQQGWDEGAYLPPELWNLFPDRLDDDGKPEGWEMQPLSELLTIIGGGTPKTSVEEYWGGDIPWFSVVDTPSASDVFVVATEKTITAHGLARSSARLIPKGATIISARGTVGNLAIAGREMTFNQSCYGLRGTGSAGDYFVYLTAQQMVDQLKSMAHGSVFSTITRQTFEAIQRPVPPSVVLTAFEGLVTGWFDAILANVEESRILAQLRDTLLPKLISGELRIADADRFLGQVGQA